MKIEMRIFYFIAVLFCLINADASHLLGGDITYTYLNGNIYRFDVTLYRDCNECTIGNQGGGNSTSNCNDLDELYVRTVTSSCGNTIIDPITLTKTGFTNITPVCNLENSVCGTNPTIAYGMEAHHYTGTIDFANYTTYTNCMFEVFFQSSERNEHINILAQEEEKLYVSAQINPWKENKSSPQFTSYPTLLFPVNEPVYGGDYVTEKEGDSIIYKWVQPLKNYTTPIPYASGYSTQHFIDAYCVTGINCSPDRTTTPPRGIYLNNTTGDYAFTPISSGQYGTRVVEIEQWRKHAGTYYLAGKVKRDIIVIVNTSSNHAPKVVANDLYEACVGETWNLSISALDNLHLPSSTQDSVELQAVYTLADLTSSTSASNTAPYQNLILNIKLDTSHIGTHFIRVKARDNYCPLYGQSEKTIMLIVRPAPQADITINDVFCGNNVIAAVTTDTLEYNLTINGSESIEPLPYVYTNFNSEDIRYKVTYTDSYGCIDSFEQIKSNLGNLAVLPALVNGSTNVCERDSLNHWLTHSDHEISSVNWETNGINYQTDTLTEVANSAQIKYSYILKENNYFCQQDDSFLITIHKTPEITLNTEPELCFMPQLDLSTVDILPEGGQWRYAGIPISTHFELDKYIPNIDVDVEFHYTVMDSTTQCKTRLPVTLKVKQAPELQLQNQQICAGDNPFNLNNIISLPFRYSTANIDWEMLTMIGAYYHDGITPKIDIPTHGTGVYRIAGKNTFANGCVAADTANILVDLEIQLSSNGIFQGCQTNQTVLLQDLFDINVEGGNWSCDQPDMVYYDSLKTENDCGDILLRYVYDQYGCYDEMTLPFNIVCRPSFNIVLEDSLCTDADPIRLPLVHQWQGNGISSDTLYPSLLKEGLNIVNASNEIEICTYDTSLAITALAPLDFKLNDIAKKLCEGELLTLDIDAPDYAQLFLKNCEQISLIIGESYIYTPTACDLATQEIALTLSSASHLNCPSHTKHITVPYFDKPKVSFTSIYEQCEPYDLYLSLEDNQLHKIDYTLSNDTEEWSGQGIQIHATKLLAGDYTLDLSLEHTNGCTAEQTAINFLSINPKPIASLSLLGEDRVPISKRQLILSSYSTIASGQLTNNWYYTKQGVSTHFSTQDNPILELPLDTGVFTLSVVAESDNYCRDTANTTVSVVPDIIAFIPNAFTPDNKGPESNSVFRVTSEHASKFHIEIFNKWGQKVFATDNIDEAWNGTYLGQHCQDGVYIYAIELVNHAGSLYKYQGTVNLLR
ncbi:MAG: gliding motility-associated-like protein [Bacteroidia bacterium]|jgi:gliding motility-associated-like protein